jgi:hypothetical protein
MPELGFDKDMVYGISHSPEIKNLSWIRNNHVFVSDYPFDQKFIIKILNSLAPTGAESILMINFAGIFGAPVDIKNFEIDSVIDTLNKNIIQFLSSIKLFSQLPAPSFFIGFSGGGVGGDNMESSSLGYLLSKISITALIEVYDKNLKKENKRLSLIAPGAFPSNMQMVVANAPIGSVSEATRKQSLELQVDMEKIIKLSNAIDWAASNPNQSGGKTLSAQRDDLLNTPLDEKFGLLRRLTK